MKNVENLSSRTVATATVRACEVALMIAIVLIGLVIVGCGDESADTDIIRQPPRTRMVGDQPPSSGQDGCVTYQDVGPYAVGLRSIELNGTPVAVWYPATQGAEVGQSKATYDIRQWLPSETATQIPDDAAPLFEMNAYENLPVASGSFPLVVFSHGLGGYRMQSSFLMTHLASYGMIVAAPEHPERNLETVLATGTIAGDNGPQTLRDTIAALRVENTSGGIFNGRLDLDRIATAGHSMGTAAAAQVAQEDDVKAWIALAGAGFGTGPSTPFLLMAGTADDVADLDTVRRGFDEQIATPRRFVSITRAGHLAFTDICLIGRDRGGVIAIAREYGLELPDALVQLATDGCQVDELPAEDGFPVINHYAVAHLKDAFGLDADSLAFGPVAQRCLGAVVNEVVNVNEQAPASPVADASSAPIDPTDAGVTPPVIEEDASPANPAPDMGVSPPPPPADVGVVQEEDPGAGVVYCRGTSGDGPICDMENTICCVGLGAEGECNPGDRCGAFQAPATCDGPEDCAEGQICCAGFPDGTSCKVECGQSAFGPEQEICNDDADCGGARTCRLCQPPGGPASQLCTDGGACPSGYSEAE